MHYTNDSQDKALESAIDNLSVFRSFKKEETYSFTEMSERKTFSSILSLT